MNIGGTKQSRLESMKPFIDKRIGFYPIHVNANLLTSEKVISLYHFAKIVFPQMGQAISASAFTNLTKGIRQWTSSITETDRNKLAQSLKGISVNVNISIEEEGRGEIITIPFNIKTDYIIENLIGVKSGVTRLDSEVKEIKEILLPVIKSAMKQRIKELAEDFFTLEVLKPEMRVEIKQLIDEGMITNEGRLSEGVTLDDLLCEEYASVFKKVDIEELARAGLIKVDANRRE